MRAFKDYLNDEYQVQGSTSKRYVFTHSLTTKLDKKSNQLLNKHTITVNIQFYDEDMNLLKKASVKFVNNDLQPKVKKSLVNIAPDELINRFNAAKSEIVNEILNDYWVKQQIINEKINQLRVYHAVARDSASDVGAPDTIIPQEFQGELVQTAEATPSSSKHFEM